MRKPGELCTDRALGHGPGKETVSWTSQGGDDSLEPPAPPARAEGVEEKILP